jgi:hypothetical protein
MAPRNNDGPRRDTTRVMAEYALAARRGDQLAGGRKGGIVRRGSNRTGDSSVTSGAQATCISGGVTRPRPKGKLQPQEHCGSSQHACGALASSDPWCEGDVAIESTVSSWQPVSGTGSTPDAGRVEDCPGSDIDAQTWNRDAPVPFRTSRGISNRLRRRRGMPPKDCAGGGQVSTCTGISIDIIYSDLGYWLVRRRGLLGVREGSIRAGILRSTAG